MWVNQANEIIRQKYLSKDFWLRIRDVYIGIQNGLIKLTTPQWCR